MVPKQGIVMAQIPEWSSPSKSNALVEPLLTLMQDRDVKGVLSYDDPLHQKVSFSGEEIKRNGRLWAKLAAAAIPQIEDLTGGRAVWEDGANGLVQLMLLLVISEIMKRD